MDHNFSPKIVDFGFAAEVANGQRCSVKLGTEAYMAPEVRARDYNPRSADLFSLGVILFVMYTGAPPFETSDPGDSYYRCFSRSNSKYWQSFSSRKGEDFFTPEFKDLINRLLCSEGKRLSVSEAKNHPWTKGDSQPLNECFS